MVEDCHAGYYGIGRGSAEGMMWTQAVVRMNDTHQNEVLRYITLSWRYVTELLGRTGMLCKDLCYDGSGSARQWERQQQQSTKRSLLSVRWSASCNLRRHGRKLYRVPACKEMRLDSCSAPYTLVYVQLHAFPVLHLGIWVLAAARQAAPLSSIAYRKL